MGRQIRFLVALVLTALWLGETAFAQLPQGFVKELIDEGLNPTSMQIAPDGRLFLAEKNGRVLVYRDDIRQLAPYLEIQVDDFNERGLSGITFHPNFEQNQWMYVYYSVPGENHNRLSRFTGNGDFVVPGSEEVLLELDPLAGTIHNGGAMEFGPDGKLYVSVGDGADAFTAQNMGSLLGKMLRLNDDGTIPTDNPFAATLQGNARAIWALGLRNSFSMDYDLDNDLLYANDVGGELFEEINHIQAGRNYGWPYIEGVNQGPSPPPDYEDPVYAYDHDAGGAVGGSAFYSSSMANFPATYIGKYFFADYCEGYIKVLDPGTGQILETFASGIDRPLAIAFSEEGEMYYIERAGLGGGSQGDNTGTTNGALWKVSYEPFGPPVIASDPASLLVSIGETATFHIEAYGNAPLSYQWRRDGTNLAGENGTQLSIMNADLSDDGAMIDCVVTNDQGQAVSGIAVLSVTSNTRPVPSIDLPAEASSYNAGDTIMFEGSATDLEDGLIPDGDLEWWIDFHHDAHSHPALGIVTGKSGSYVIPRVGETDDNVWYRIYLRTSDSGGLSKTVYHEIFPNKVTVTFESSPPRVELNVDGQKIITPSDITSVSGIVRTISAPDAYFTEDEVLVFSQWENGTDDLLTSFVAPTSDTTIMVHYDAVPLGNGVGLLGKYYSDQVQSFDGEPDLIRLDPVIDFDWVLGSPDPSISVDDFTIRWTGGLTSLFSETYTFYTATDDGVRLWIDDELVIDQWIPQPVTEWSGSIDLMAGEEVSVVLEFFEQGGEAVVKLFWSSESTPKQIIPQSQFTSSVLTSISEEAIDGSPWIYPNPVSSILQIDISSEWAGGELRILDTQGKSHYRGIVRATGPQRMDVGNLRPGQYAVLLVQEGQTQLYRFVKL